MQKGFTIVEPLTNTFFFTIYFRAHLKEGEGNKHEKRQKHMHKNNNTHFKKVFPKLDYEQLIMKSIYCTIFICFLYFFQQCFKSQKSTKSNANINTARVIFCWKKSSKSLKNCVFLLIIILEMFF